MQADINNKRFKFNGRSYFTSGSTSMTLGLAGEKKSPALKPKTLDPHRAIKPARLEVATGAPIEIDLTVGKMGALSALVPLVLPNVPAPLPIGWEHLSGRIIDGEITVVQLSVDDQTLTRAANDTPPVLNGLLDWGADGRVIDQVFVVVHYDVAEKFRQTNTVKIETGLGGDIGLNVGGGGIRAGTVQVRLSPGAIMAYQLVKPVWNASKKKDRTRIDHFRLDQYGTG